MANEKTGAPEPKSEISALTDAFRQVIQSVQPAPGLTKDDLSEVLKDNSEGIRRALKPENQTHPDISYLNPLGERDHPRPPLKRPTFWAGQPLYREDLSREEIDLLNGFTHTKEARNGQWRAEVRVTGSRGGEELHVSFPCRSADDRMALPRGMALILMEIKDGASAVDPQSMADRIATLEQQLAQK